DYERHFGGYFREMTGDNVAPTRLLMAYAMDGFYANGGSSAYVLRAMDEAATAVTATRDGLIEASSPGIWADSLSLAFLPPTGPDATRFRIAVVYSPPVGEARVVESWDRLSTDPDDENFVVEVLKRSLYINWIEGVAPSVPILVPNIDEDDIVTAAEAMTVPGAGGGADLTAAAYGPLMSERLAGVDDAALLVAGCDAMLDGADNYVEFVNAFIGFADNRPRQDLFFVGDLPRQSGSPTDATSDALTALDDVNRKTFAGLYWPHLVVGDIVGQGRNPRITVPPAGYVAGLFSRIDGRRGVWKAPAGTEATLNATIELEHQINDLHSDDLNPQGVNALRLIPGAGRVVWGARTLVPGGEWRYVPVRRTAIFLRTSIYNGIQWAVFEPNDEPLWASLRASVGGFMQTQFRNGAFAGRTSDEAYFVKVDAETTPEIDQAAGIVNILVGFAPLRPAEFVVVQLSQKTQTAA
ncbi:MAG: phage tail sheath family protein, partial [Thermoleophilaceae bacterium]